MLVRRLLIILMLYSCASKSTISLDSGLIIENGVNRGLNYTDPKGTLFSYRYIPITITNDSTVAIEFQISFANAYEYPATYGDQSYEIFVLPLELTQEEVTFDNKSYEIEKNPLRDFFDKSLKSSSVLTITLKPGEQYELTLGTLYPRPTDCGVVPNALFIQDSLKKYNACHRMSNKGKSTYSPFDLGLKLNFCDGCVIMPIGKITLIEI